MTMQDGTSGIPDVETSGDQTGTSAEQVTMTTAELDELKAKVWSDSRAALGREEKAAKEGATAEQSALDLLKQSDPDAFERLSQKREQERAAEQARQREADLRAREEALAEKEGKTKASEMERVAAELASERNVSKDTLLKYGGETAESMRELAEHLAPTSGTPIHADSARTTGGGTKTLAELQQVDTRGMGIDQLKEHEKAVDAALAALR